MGMSKAGYSISPPKKFKILHFNIGIFKNIAYLSREGLFESSFTYQYKIHNVTQLHMHDDNFTKIIFVKNYMYNFDKEYLLSR